MLRSGVGARAMIGGNRTAGLRQRNSLVALRVCRPSRQPRLGISAFKDWFNGLVQHREPQAQPQAMQVAGQEQSAASTAQVATPPVALPKVAPKRDFLEARQVSLFQLFDSSDYKFDIPTYQRPYAWQTKQIYELLQDFVKAYQTRQEYFLGAIVATKAADGAHVPYQLIDGQQRLTSMVILLAFLHGWAREQGNEVLEGRIRRMLYLDADPLEPGSSGRYRLRLRDADDAFFRTNVLDSFLPTHYRLAGVAANAAASDAAAAVATAAASAVAHAEGAAGVPGAAAGSGPGGAATLPLENETWWRLYDNAAFLRGQLNKLVAEGLNLQDFTFHILRNCFVVMMVARDEGASFRIFSTLNGRGMDLSVVDKLKADLLAGELSPAERSHYSDAWAEMESVLGRTAFHRVFDYMRDLAAVRDPWVGETSVLDYFTRKVDDPRAVKQVLQVSLDYARLLLQLRQASWSSPQLAALLAETPAAGSAAEDDEGEADGVAAPEERAAVVAVAVQALAQPAAPVLAPEEEGLHLEALHAEHRRWQDAGADAPVAAEPLAAVEPVAEMRLEVEVKAVTLPEATATVGVPEPEAEAEAPVASLQPQGAVTEEQSEVIVFRFDTPAPPSAIGPAEAASGDVLPSQTEAFSPGGAFPGSEAASLPALAAAAGAGADGQGPLDVASTAPSTAPEATQLELEEALELLEAAVAAEDASGLDASLQQQQPVSYQASALHHIELAPPAPAAEAAGANAAEVAVAAPPPVAVVDEGLPAAVAAVDEAAAPATTAAAAAAAVVVEAALEAAQPGPSQGLMAVTDAAEELADARVLQEAVMAAAVEAVDGISAASAAEDEEEALERTLQAALLAELDTRSHHLNMFTDEAWLPPLLEFFYQTDDLQQRVAFMKGAEALQLLLELMADPAAKAARWGVVSEALLERPFRPEAVLEALALSDTERDAFRARLDSKDLYGTVDHRTLRHLLVRCEPSFVAQQQAGVSGFTVEKIAPQSAPEGSTWRKTRIASHCDPQSPWPESFWSAASSSEPASAEELAAARHAPAPSSSSPPSSSFEVKYWYEVQRLNWHGKLGNLVLLPATAASAASSAVADYEAKAALWRQAGVAARLPAFTAPIVEPRGRYGRFKFCYDECRQRHEDMMERLTEVFEL